MSLGLDGTDYTYVNWRHLGHCAQWTSTQWTLDNCVAEIDMCPFIPTRPSRTKSNSRLRHTWLRTVEADLRPFNLGLASGFKKAQDRTTWRALTGTATSPTSPEWLWWWPSPTHKLSNPTQNVINTDPTQVTQPNVRSGYVLLLSITSPNIDLFKKKCLTYNVNRKFVIFQYVNKVMQFDHQYCG